MFFQKMRNQMKTIVIIVVVAMAGGLLWAGGSFFFGRKDKDQVQASAMVATVNGEGISQYDLHQAFLTQLQKVEQEQGRLPGIAYEAVKFDALDTLIGNAVIIQEINNRKMTASKKEIDEELQFIIDQFPSKDDFKLQLQMLGLSEEILRAQITEEIKFEKLKREILSEHEVSEQEIKEAYERVRTSHILIVPEVSEEVSEEEQWAIAEKNAWEIYEQVTEENFAELAKEHSADSSSDNGGDLGFISRGDTIPEFENVAFDLSVGAISEPVKSMYGYHIITVTERQEAEGEEFDKVRNKLADLIRQNKGRDDLIAWFEKVEEEADIVYIDLAMNAFAQVQKGNYEDAVHYYNLAIEEQPNDGYLYASLAEVYKELDNPTEAINQYVKATEIFNNDQWLYMSLGNLYIEEERIDEGVEALLRASELAPNDFFTQLSIYGQINELERYDDAKIVEERIAAYQEMLKESSLAEEFATDVIELNDEETTE